MVVAYEKQSMKEPTKIYEREREEKTMKDIG